MQEVDQIYHDPLYKTSKRVKMNRMMKTNHTNLLNTINKTIPGEQSIINNI